MVFPDGEARAVGWGRVRSALSVWSKPGDAGGRVATEMSDDQLKINPAPSSDCVVFLRSGDLEKEAQSTLIMEQVFVYRESGALDLSGGTGGLETTAPVHEDLNFEDLALWAEAPLQFDIGGQSGNILEGTSSPHLQISSDSPELVVSYRLLLSSLPGVSKLGGKDRSILHPTQTDPLCCGSAA
jgi:hypothetical protein